MNPAPVARLALLPLVAAFAVSGCAGAGGATPTPTPKPATGCVTRAQATQIWTSIDKKLNAIELDPKHAGLSAVATGNAFGLITDYLQNQLVNQHFTEREVDRLDSLTVVNAGCNNGTLELKVGVTATRDDYLTPSGHVDHSDPLVGVLLHIDESFTRSGGGWKESDFVDLDLPPASPTPQLLAAPPRQAEEPTAT